MSGSMHAQSALQVETHSAASNPTAPPDFWRDVRCVLGLPFDTVTLAQAEQVVRRALVPSVDPAAPRKRCFFSTPNLNFAVGCMADAAFRASVLQSDLNLADGWPIVAIAKLTGAQLPERVAGSTLFERLVASPVRPPIKVYLFGGPDGAAQMAAERLNAQQGGVVCSGFDSPGFASVKTMSSPEHLARLNQAEPDLVVVALGAKKGQAWIQANLQAMCAPVVSHLGAVVNFTAGTIARAPRWAQALKLEWLWRIKEEPQLWQRYASDGATLMRLLFTRVLPLALQQRRHAPKSPTLAHARIEQVEYAQRTTLRLTGAWTQHNVAPLREFLAAHAASHSPVALDLGEVSFLDPTAIGLLSLLYGWQIKIGASWKVVAVSKSTRKTLRWACAEYLLQPF
jgi:N-acetylglucosaminyldiphosphoundecaprenol N-acetyl-beta-D-mannosaminyltransferase